MVPWLEDLGDFPHSSLALSAADDADGLLCASASISAALLQRSYPRGIYPWYSKGDPVMWWTPSQRAVLRVADFKLHKSLRKTIVKYQASGTMTVRVDTAFEAVLAACADRPAGTWMTAELRAAYTDWHTQGAVHSVETWLDGHLVGGFYGVGIGQMFFGESMFSRITDASKIALACFVGWFATQGGDMIDCQQDTAHLMSLGAKTLPRAAFEALIAQRTVKPALDWAAAGQTDLLMHAPRAAHNEALHMSGIRV
jgi:leucyl/phenylalanyl-tRNA---protein transferase